MDELSKRENALTHQDKLHTQAIQQLEAHTRTILETLNKLKERDTNALRAICEERNIEIKGQRQTLKDMLVSAEQAQARLKDAKESQNKSQVYVCCSLADQLSAACAELRSGLASPDVLEIVFQPHCTSGELFNSLLSRNSLGTFSEEINLPVLKTQNLGVRVALDEIECNITGSCAVDSDETYLIVDNSNVCLKRFKMSNSSVVDRLKLDHKPWSVCVVGTEEAAVTLSALHKVTFVSLSGKMKKTKSMTVGYECYAVASQGGGICFFLILSKI